MAHKPAAGKEFPGSQTMPPWTACSLLPLSLASLLARDNPSPPPSPGSKSPQTGSVSQRLERCGDDVGAVMPLSRSAEFIPPGIRYLCAVWIAYGPAGMGFALSTNARYRGLWIPYSIRGCYIS
jgi:hypothetical protein